MAAPFSTLQRMSEDVWSIQALKEYVDQRFASSEVAVTTALSSAEKAVTAALTAAEKAVEKAEAAQGRVNETQNEFRGTLKDQAAELMPRAETELLVKDLLGQIGDLRTSRDASSGGISVLVWMIGIGLILLSIIVSSSIYFATHH